MILKRFVHSVSAPERTEADHFQHILMKKHRKFAEDSRNWSKLDTLLGQLQRVLKYEPRMDEEGSEDYPEYY